MSKKLVKTGFSLKLNSKRRLVREKMPLARHVSEAIGVNERLDHRVASGHEREAGAQGIEEASRGREFGFGEARPREAGDFA